MNDSGVLFRLGPLGISVTVVTTWAIMLALAAFSALATRRLREEPGTLQTVLEGVVLAMERAIAACRTEAAEGRIPLHPSRSPSNPRSISLNPL